MILASYNEFRFTNAVDTADANRTPLIAEAVTSELTGLQLGIGTERFTFDEITTAAAGATRIPYEQAPTSGLTQLRLIEQTRTLYRGDDLSSPLPLGTVEPRALPFESYSLAFTPGLVGVAYGGRVTNIMLTDEGRYVHSEGDANWWVPSGLVFYSPGSSDTAAQELAYAQTHFFLPHRTRDPFHTSAVSTERFMAYDGYDLLLQETWDILGNRITAGERNQDPTQPPVLLSNDYRVLQPALLMDPNRNRSAIAFDALGLVVGSAVMGKPEDSPVPGDQLTANFRADLTQAEIDQFFADPEGPAAAALLDEATTRLVYDLMAYRRNPAAHAPSMVGKIDRETHASDPIPPGGLRLQVSFSYSDGFSREIQKKVQTEPGPTPQRDANGRIVLDANGQPVMTTGNTDPRWIGTGWTIFDNKGDPVLQYEPFYTDTHHFESDARIGVSSVLFYDPAGRMVATLRPDHSWQKILFDAWEEEHWDVNDTVLTAPASDEVIGPFVSRLPNTDYLPTWYDRRSGGTLGAAEQDAAAKTEVHAGTPSLVYADTLGRAFVTVAHNRFEQNGTPIDEYYTTRVVLDIEGNRREVHDASDRVIMRYDYDISGTVVHQTSMEAGERWILTDVANGQIYAWDSRGFQFQTTYDQLRRPVASFVKDSGGTQYQVARTIFGETLLQPEATNTRKQAVQHHDQAGLSRTEHFDFKGNLLQSQRQLAKNYASTLDWAGSVDLETEVFTSVTSYDALDRPVQVTTPDNSIYLPAYDASSRLATVDMDVRGSGNPTRYIQTITYNARGQREQVTYGNQVTSEYAYDPETFRLQSLTTTRASDHAAVQGLTYTYDPVGNITQVQDSAQQTVYFNNQAVTPNNDHTFDAAYRLIAATGREQIGQASTSQTTWNDQGRVALPLPGDGQAMRRYVEQYTYDPTDNIQTVVHQASSGNWTRSYTYAEPSLIEPTKINNGLTRTVVGTGTPESYGYDANGNTVAMPHLTLMAWDFKNQLQATARQTFERRAGGNDLLRLRRGWLPGP